MSLTTYSHCTSLCSYCRRYLDYATKAALGEDENFRWCLRPGCNNGQYHESGTDGPIFRCAACGFRLCVIHNSAWHEGYTCSEWDYKANTSLKQKEEEASVSTIQRTTKRCPGRNCGAPIEKNDGCDHMTCKSSQFSISEYVTYLISEQVGNADTNSVGSALQTSTP